MPHSSVMALDPEHYPGCWRDEGHRACSVALADRLGRALDALCSAEGDESVAVGDAIWDEADAAVAEWMYPVEDVPIGNREDEVLRQWGTR